MRCPQKIDGQIIVNSEKIDLTMRMTATKKQLCSSYRSFKNG